MTIDADVQITAKRFGLDPRLLQAVVNAEGDILKAVRCSLPKTETRQQALEITCRSCVHALRDFITDHGFSTTFIDYWGHRWAPEGVANDPRGLNHAWIANVVELWTGEK